MNIDDVKHVNDYFDELYNIVPMVLDLLISVVPARPVVKVGELPRSCI